MKEIRISNDELRKAGVLVNVSSRSYSIWIGKLRPILRRRGVSQAAIDGGRAACHVQASEDGVLFRFRDPDDAIKRNAALRAAQAAMMEHQANELARPQKRPNRRDDG